MVTKKIPFGFPVFLLLLAVCFTGCQTTPAGMLAPASKVKKAIRKAEKAAEQEDRDIPLAQSMQVPIGTIHMVDRLGGFVLIKSNRTTILSPDTEVKAYRDDASVSANLKVSPARKGSYLTADLVDGTPAVGDIVMMVYSLNKKPGGEEEEAGDSVQVLE